LLRFAVHGPGTPDASPRSHGMSCRDVSGRVQVRVAVKTARPATEDGLALARSSVNRSARAAALRRECRVYSFCATGSLFLKPALEEPPARGKDLSVQAGLPGYSSSRLSEGTLDRTGHAADVQVLDTNQVGPPGEVSAELLAPASTGADLTSLELRDSKFCPGAATRSTLASRQLALEQPKPSLAARTQSRNLPQFAGGKRCGHVDTESCLRAPVLEDRLLCGCGTQPGAAHANTVSRAPGVSGKLGRPSANGRDARLRSV
jgi:hypothetical protein